MKKIAVVIDSTTLISDYLKKHNDVYIIPLSIIINDISYRDDIEIKREELLKSFKTDSVITTSQPTLNDSIECFEKIKSKNYEKIYIISINKHLSGTMSSFELAAKQVDLKNYWIIDTLTVAGANSYMAETILKMNEKGYSEEDIEKMVNIIIDNNDTYLYPYSMDRLVKSGRLNKAIGVIASGLKLRLLLSFKGKSTSINKHGIYTTQKKLIKEMIEACKKQGFRADNTIFYMLEVSKPDAFELMKKAFINEFGDKCEFRMGYIPSVIVTHLGDNIVGLQAVRKIEL